MKPAEVLKQLRELKETWSKQSFSFNRDQKAEYAKLLELRRERVKSFYKNGLVHKGGATVKKTTEKP